jgi:MarR family transcriptional regulator, organic hydroperoxide resistance regulator
MADERQSIIEDIIASQQSIYRAIGASVPSVWMKLDLSMAQFKTLMALYNCGALPIGQIAEILGVGQPTASHLVDRLVQTRLVSRTEDPLDRRRTLAQLSPSGEELAEQINQVRFAALRRWLAQLDDAALTAFHQGSRALAAVAKSETSQVSETT